MEWRWGDYEISTDRVRLSLEAICSFLARSYWAGHRSRGAIERSLDHSLCYGLYYCGGQIGFARVVTDYATFYWLCDVFIDEAHREKGLGKWLIRCVLETPEVEGLEFGFLLTQDAHDLYAEYGFEEGGAIAKALMYRPRKELAGEKNGHTEKEDFP